MDAKRWPDSETILTIGKQSRQVSEFIRDALPTTAGKRPFGANAMPGIVTELDRLTYLFYGRTLADYDADLRQAEKLGWWMSLAGWIVATPGPNEHPVLADSLNDLEVMHSNYCGWPNPIPAHVDAIFNAVATLRVYFGQIVFCRDYWIREGAWLRDEIQSRMVGLACCPDAQLGPWFDAELIRAPMYLLRKPNTLPQGPLPIPAEIERCGIFSAPKTEGVPVEWLDALDHYSEKLSDAISSLESAANGQGDDADGEHDSRPKKKPTVNDRMKAELAINMNTVKGWTVRQWASHLECSVSGVANAQTWKELELLRTKTKAEKAMDRHRKSKPVKRR